MEKKAFKDNLGNIHFGIEAPVGFQEIKKDEMTEVLEGLGERKLWRCNVCNDLHISIEPLEECPTCHVFNAYVEIELSEFKQLMAIL